MVMTSSAHRSSADVWSRVQLKDVAVFRSGQRDTNTAVQGGEFPFFVCSSEILRCDRFDFDDEAVVMAGNNADGVFHLHHFAGKFAARQRTYVITPRTDQLHCRWLFHQLTLLQPHFQAAAIGTTTRYVTIDMLRGAEILLPDVKVQRAISETLSDADKLLGGLDRLIAKKRDLKQAAMQQLLTGQTRLPGFRGEWEVKRLGEVASMTKGTQLHSSESSAEGEFPHFNGGISPSSYTDKTNTPANTIAISEGGNSCGYVQFISEPFWCGGHCYAVVPKDVDKRFLYHALKGQQSAIMGLRVGSGLPNVQKTALAAFNLSVPSNPFEQAAIASILSDMDAELAALEARRDKTRDLKQAMMQELLTGKTRLVPPGAAYA